jgi:hypothetical protein
MMRARLQHAGCHAVGGSCTAMISVLYRDCAAMNLGLRYRNHQRLPSDSTLVPRCAAISPIHARARARMCARRRDVAGNGLCRGTARHTRYRTWRANPRPSPLPLARRSRPFGPRRVVRRAGDQRANPRSRRLRCDWRGVPEWQTSRPSLTPAIGTSRRGLAADCRGNANRFQLTFFREGNDPCSRT